MTDYTYLGGVVNGNGNRRQLPNDPNSIELLVQQQIDPQLLLSLTTHQRHDSLLQYSPSSTPRQSISRHQAEAQPYTLAPTTPHTANSYPQRPVNMSRSASQYSSASSDHYQKYGNQHRASCGSFDNVSPTIAPDVPRSASQYSVPSIIQQRAPQPSVTQPHHDTVNYLPAPPSNIPPTSSPANPQSTQTPKYTADPMFEFDVNDIMDGTLAGDENGSKPFGQMTTSSGNMNFPVPFSPSFHSQLGSFGHQAPHENSVPVDSYSDIETSTISRMPLVPPLHPPPPLSQQPVRRRRRASPSPDAPSDPVIGQVTRLGKFKCLDPGCDDLTFGRQADFKRHYENVHAPRKIEYFCPKEGCSRSRKPTNGKSKGRSFNSRKDKMEEHVRTVHHKEGKRRTVIEEVEDEIEEDDSLDEKVTEKRPRIRRRLY